MVTREKAATTLLVKTMQGYKIMAGFLFSIAALMFVMAIVLAVHAKEPVKAVYPLGSAAIFFFVGLAIWKLRETKA